MAFFVFDLDGTLARIDHRRHFILQPVKETLSILRKRVGACIKGCVNQGLVVSTGQTTDHGAFGPYKLWELRRNRVAL